MREYYLNKQVEEAELKAAEQFQEQERRKQDMKDAIERSRKMQMERKKKEKEMEKKEESEFAEYWKVRNQELQEAEQRELEEERERAAADLGAARGGRHRAGRRTAHIGAMRPRARFGRPPGRRRWRCAERR